MSDTLTTKSYRALIYDELEEYKEAIQMLTDHLFANPTNSVAYNNRGLAYWEIGQREKALADFGRAIEFCSNDYIPYLNRADFFEHARPSGRFAEAIDDYSRALSIAPNDPGLHRCKAHACLKLERLEEALDSFSNAIRLDPDFRHAYLERAETYQKLGRDEEAQADRLHAATLPENRTQK